MQRPPLLLVFEVRVMFGIHPPPNPLQPAGGWRVKQWPSLFSSPLFHQWGLRGVGWDCVSVWGPETSAASPHSHLCQPEMCLERHRESSAGFLRGRAAAAEAGGVVVARPRPLPPPMTAGAWRPSQNAAASAPPLNTCQQYLSLTEKRLPVRWQIVPCLTLFAVSCSE